MTRRPLLLWPLLVTLLTVLLDRVSKYFVVRYLGPTASVHSVPILEPWIRLTYLENTGVSFGQLQQFSTWVTLFNMVAVVGLLFAYRYLLTSNRWANLALGLVLGGAIGNVIDRVTTALRLGLANAYVVDFFDMRYYAVANIADAGITFGGIIYAAYLLFGSRSQAKKEANPEEATCQAAEQPPES